MSFFAQMGNCWHTLPDGSTVLLNDITTYAIIEDSWRNDARVQMTYKINDGELPHMISVKLYNKVDYWWTILKINNIFDFDNQWPRNHDQLADYIERKYPDNKGIDVHHYIDGNGLIADLLSLRIVSGLTDDAEVINTYGLEAISIDEYETATNDLKRDIILIDPDYIDTVTAQYDAAMEA